MVYLILGELVLDVGAIALALATVGMIGAALWFNGKEETAKNEAEEKKILSDFVYSVKEEIEKIKAKYPKLSPDAVIEGNNVHKYYDQGNIYDEATNLTFGIHTPIGEGVGSSGETTLETRKYIMLSVSGTVSDYRISGVSRLSKKKAFKVIYSSKHGNAIEGMIA